MDRKSRRRGRKVAPVIYNDMYGKKEPCRTQVKTNGRTKNAYIGFREIPHGAVLHAGVDGL